MQALIQSRPWIAEELDMINTMFNALLVSRKDIRKERKALLNHLEEAAYDQESLLLMADALIETSRQ